ncbi:MAG: hypothetical protein RL398_2662 [Planctomycetota bacterium]
MTELAERFATVLTRVFGQCERVADLDAAARRIAELLGEVGATRVALSDAAEVARTVAPLRAGGSITFLPHDAARDELLQADVGITTAQFGIAETGTLVLASAHERHRLASLLPKLHIALLPVSRLVGSLGDALARLAPSGTPQSRAITFVTGPSRTADIELELVVGVHGPSRLVVLLVETP